MPLADEVEYKSALIDVSVRSSDLFDRWNNLSHIFSTSAVSQSVSVTFYFLPCSTCSLQEVKCLIAKPVCHLYVFVINFNWCSNIES